MTVEYRRAVPADNAAILEFMTRHSMPGELQLRFDRSPDFFALSDAHSPDNETWLMLDGVRIKGLGSLVVRPGYVHGNVEPVVYLSDLRVAPNRRSAGQWRSRFRELLHQIAADTGARYAYCAIIRDNRLARNSIALHQAFGFRHLTGYSIISLLACKPFRRPSNYQVSRASVADAESLSDLLNRFSHDLVFGPVFDSAEFERRMSTWPGFDLDNFFLARDAAGDLVGCLAPWDYSALKKIVIDAMPLSADWMRRIFNVAAPIHKRAKIAAPPASIIPDVAITHVAIPDRNVAVFRALLNAAVREVFRGRNAATVSLCLYDGDPFWPVVADYWRYAVPMDLYSLRIDADAPELTVNDDCFPGFEFYLV